jgi:hypothetical protein
MAMNERNEKSDYTSGSPDQAGASGAYSNSAIAMMPPGLALPASEQERVLAIKIARAMASGRARYGGERSVSDAEFLSINAA